MGTLTELGIIGSETSEQRSRVAFRQQTSEAIRFGEVLLFGVPLLSPNGPILLPELLPVFRQQAADALDEFPEDFQNNMADALINTYELIDKIPAANVAKPLGITDPTAPLMPVIKILLDIIFSLGIDNPLPWFIERIPKIMSPLELPKWTSAIAALATCDYDPLAERMVSVDDSLSKSEVLEKLRKEVGNTGKTLCEFVPPPLPLPTLSIPPLPVPFIQPWTWDIFQPPFFPLPPEIPLPFFNPTLPAIGWNLNPIPWNWIFELHIIPAIIKAIQEIIAKVAELIAKIPEGLIAFITAIIEMVVEVILAALAAIAEMLEQFITFTAAIAVYLKNTIASLVVSIVGLILGPGIITFGAAHLLGLLPE